MNYKKEKLKSIVFSIIIATLLLVIGILSLKVNNYKYSLLYEYQTVPDIELFNGLYVRNGNILGEASGFVAFLEKDKQPKTLKQYYVIKSRGNSSSLSLEEVVKMAYLPPKNIGSIILEKVDELDGFIKFVDEGGNYYFVNIESGLIWMTDLDGDKTALITSESGYKDLIQKRLK
jgi:hypothetical protein